MTDKTLMQEARDALKENHDLFVQEVNDHREDSTWHHATDCPTCELLTSLDAELAGVAQPVVLDLSGVDQWDSLSSWRKEGILAAIRAQLPNVEVRT